MNTIAFILQVVGGGLSSRAKWRDPAQEPQVGAIGSLNAPWDDGTNFPRLRLAVRCDRLGDGENAAPAIDPPPGPHVR